MTAWEREELQQAKQTRTDLETKLAQITVKLERLLDAHLDDALTREEYVARKERLLHQKAKLQEQLGKTGNMVSAWLEPCKQFFDTLFQADYIASSENPGDLATYLKTAGSNLTLRAGKPHCHWEKPWSLAANRSRKKQSCQSCSAAAYPSAKTYGLA